MNSGKTIKIERQRKKLTQKQLAKLCGVGQSYISHWECGDFLPSPKLAGQVADRLNIDRKVLAKRVEDERLRQRLARYGAEETEALAYGVAEEAGIAPINISSNHAWEMLKYFSDLPEELQIAEVERLRLMALGHMLDNGRVNLVVHPDKGADDYGTNVQDDQE